MFNDLSYKIRNILNYYYYYFRKSISCTSVISEKDMTPYISSSLFPLNMLLKYHKTFIGRIVFVIHNKIINVRNEKSLLDFYTRLCIEIAYIVCLITKIINNCLHTFNYSCNFDCFNSNKFNYMFFNTCVYSIWCICILKNFQIL